MRRLALVALALWPTAIFAAVDYTRANVSAFEAGGVIECADTSGTPSSSTSAARSGNRGMRLAAAGDECSVPVRASGSKGYASGNWANGSRVIFGFAVRFSDATPASATRFFYLSSNTLTRQHMRLELQTDGTVDLMDAGDVARVSTTTLSDNTWYYFEVFILVDNAGTGQAELFLDGSSVGSDTTNDWSENGLPDDFVGRFVFATPNATQTMDVDDFYQFSGDASLTSADRFSISSSRLPEIFVFMGGAGTGVPDATGTGTTGGSTLDAGNWTDCDGQPTDAGTCSYTAAGAVDGAIWTDDLGANSCSGGPSGCSLIDSDAAIKIVLYYFYANRSGGSATTHTIYYGNDAETGLSGTASLGTSVALFGVEDVSATMPLSTQNARLGIGKSSGGRDFVSQDHWAAVVHVPDAVAGGSGRRWVGGAQ
jgi:hypothetical protein